MEEVLFRGYLMQGFGISSINKKFWFVLLYLVFSIVSIVRINQLNELNFIHNSIILVGFGLVYFLMNYLGVLKSLFKTKFSLIMFNFFNRSFTPLFLTSVIFGLLHGANPEVEKLGWIMMIYYIGTGLLLGVFALMDEGIELSLGFHAANNIIAAVLVTSNWAAFQTDALFIDIAEPTVDFEFFLPFILFYPIVVFVFSKKYGWTNWKEKLFGTVRKPIEFDEDRFIA